MSQSSATVVRVKTTDGTWETLGADRARGVWPENVTSAANDWGPDTASFDLRRDPAAVWPDIAAFTPVEIEVDGAVVWDGRVKETPSRQGPTDMVMSVQCEGWQYHLDDDAFRTFYVHTALSEWKDMRTLPAANLALAVSGGQVTSDGTIALVIPQSTTVPASTRVGVVLDLAPYGGTFTSVAVDWESSNNAAGISFACTATDSDDPGATASSTAFSFPLNSGTSGTAQGAPSTAYSKIFLFLYWSAGGTPSADVFVKIKGVRVFRSGTYNGGGVSAPSVLRASHVVTDALSKATLLLSSDRSRIQSTSFDIPSFAPAEHVSPREAWQAVNAYHDWQARIDIGRVPVFAARPTSPVVEVGEWSAMDVQDAAANSGQEIYNRVFVTATAPDGSTLVVPRTSATLSSATSRPSSSNLVNPAFDVDVSGWTAVNSTITRTTTAGEYDSGPAGGKWGNYGSVSNVPVLTGTTTGTFRAGRTYECRFSVRSALTSFTCFPRFGVNGDEASVAVTPGGGFVQKSIFWTPAADTASARFVISLPPLGSGQTIYLDNVKVYEAATTLVDRTGFNRTKNLQVRSTLPTDGVAAAQIGDVFLSGHQTTPFKGTVTITGDHSIRDAVNGQPVSPSRLLTMTGQLMRFSDRVDPDTGGQSRDGRITAVSYDHAERKATVTLDNTRNSFEALLERLAVVSGR